MTYHFDLFNSQMMEINNKELISGFLATADFEAILENESFLEVLQLIGVKKEDLLRLSNGSDSERSIVSRVIISVIQSPLFKIR